MPLSPSPSSSVPSRCLADTTPMRAAADRADTTDDDGSDSDYGDSGGCEVSQPAAARFTSCFRSQKSLVALCKKLGAVDTKEFTPLLAGDRHACSPPPPGAVCVYADALEAGMRVPLHPFFGEVLSHFGIAPSQLTPNGWRVMAGFLALSRSAGVDRPPSLAVFRHFFSLCPLNGRYHFRRKDAAGVLFTGMPRWPNKWWKEEFFFLKSRAPWPCPVLWGEPTRKSVAEQGLTDEEETVAEKLLRARGAAPIDLQIYIHESNVAAATMVDHAPLPLSSSSRRTTDAKGMDPSTYSMMQNMRAEKTAVWTTAEEVAVKIEPGDSGDSDWTPLSGKKRKLEDENAEHALRGSVLGACAAVPPGFSKHPERRPRLVPDSHDGVTADWEESRCLQQSIVSPAAHGSVPGARTRLVYSRKHKKKSQQVPDWHDGDTADLDAARQLLQGIVTPSRERAFTAAKPSDVVDSTYMAILQAANYASFSLDHARRLQDELAKAKAELAEATKATAAEVKSAKSAAVQEFLGSEEHERQLTAEALKGYQRGMDDMKRVALRLRPDLDAAKLFVPRAWRISVEPCSSAPCATELHAVVRSHEAGIGVFSHRQRERRC